MSSFPGVPALEIVDGSPEVAVQQAEYLRLLGYPRGFVLTDRARELADWARDWYARHGRPWVYAREAHSVEPNGPDVVIDGVRFSSARLAKTLRDASGHTAIVVAVTAGPEIEHEAQVRWLQDKPDEYFFLEVYGSAVVEHLVTMTGARLCAWAESRGMAVLPHYSPGYPDWEIAEQPRLLDLIRLRLGPSFPVETLDSGMLRPKKSLLAAFGLTRQVDRVARLTDLVPCANCSFTPCQYRRAPYRRTPRASNPELRAFTGSGDAHEPGVALDRDARYSVSVKALQRWSNERLTIETRADGTMEAQFRYDGTTCTNMGRPLQFHYQVRLGPRAEGYPIREQRCTPAPGDEGYTYMCKYLVEGSGLLAAIDREHPMRGQPLNEVLDWARPAAPAGCYCDVESRQHKWGLVLETIHYELARRERAADPGPLENDL
jgi:hypothetical protein